MRHVLLIVALVLFVGCGGSQPATDAPPEPDASLLDVWTGLDEAFTALGDRAEETCDAPFTTWFADFGVRGLACAAVQVVAPTSFLARAPVAPFRSGPHIASLDTVRLDLSSPRNFGHYDPAFVRWLVAHAIPDDGPARTLTQPVYDRRVRRLARIYWLTYADLDAQGFPESIAVGPLAEYAAFLEGGSAQDSEFYGSGEGFSVFAFTELSEALLPRVGIDFANDWTAKYEANTAYGFWLRRRIDGTLNLWHNGLRQLLQTYDSAWLAEGG